MNESLTKRELINYCANPLHNCVVGSTPYSNTVVRISSQAVIKFGVRVRKAEAINQLKACTLVDPQIVCIPKVH